MIRSMQSAPPPDLRILSIESVYPHEVHDSQRSDPLLNILRYAQYLTNPVLVAPMDDGSFVVMDGANRYHCFRELGYPHLLVQVVEYVSPFVELGVWNHIISDWDETDFVERLHQLPDTTVKKGWNYRAVAQILMQNGTVLSLDAPNETIAERNHTLRKLVTIYQRHARLSRTALGDPTQIWPLFPDAIALVLFPLYLPNDIIAAAQQKAFLPPGVSRHIVHGRALKMHYPLDKLKDTAIDLQAKNEALQQWVREKLATHAVRYYAESTYQFDE